MTITIIVSLPIIFYFWFLLKSKSKSSSSLVKHQNTNDQEFHMTLYLNDADDDNDDSKLYFDQQEQEYTEKMKTIEQQLTNFCQDDSKMSFHFVLYYHSFWSKSFIDRIQTKINEILHQYPFIKTTKSSDGYCAFVINHEPKGYHLKRRWTKNILDMIFTFDTQNTNYYTTLLSYSDEKWQDLLKQSYAKLQQLQSHISIEQIEAKNISNRPKHLFPCYIYEPHVMLQVWQDSENHLSLDTREPQQLRQALIYHDCTSQELDQMMHDIDQFEQLLENRKISVAEKQAAQAKLLLSYSDLIIQLQFDDMDTYQVEIKHKWLKFKQTTKTQHFSGAAILK